MTRTKKVSPQQKPAPEVPVGMAWDEFLEKLPREVNRGSLTKAFAMLRKDKFRLFSEAQADQVHGIVRAQSNDKRVYVCRLANDGRYSCCTQNLIKCVVSDGSPCKHLLVLVIGLVKAGKLDCEETLAWLRRAYWMGHTDGGNTPDKEVVTATFIKYKSMEAGEIDWRPTETLPEDFYSA